MPQTPKCRRTQNARALALHLLPGHSRYCCGIPVVGLDDQIRNSRRAAGVANHDAGMANHETLRVAHEEDERDRSLSIARGPLRAWRASAPARRRGTRAEYERECVNVTSVCGTTCERGGASLGATARVGKSQVAALLLRDSKPTRMLSKPTRILSGSFGKDRPRCRPFICVSQERQEQRRQAETTAELLSIGALSKCAKLGPTYLRGGAARALQVDLATFELPNGETIKLPYAVVLLESAVVFWTERFDTGTPPPLPSVAAAAASACHPDLG